MGVSLQCVTVHLCKRRWQKVGLGLTGEQYPRIVTSTDDRFQPSDLIYMINGREMNQGCHKTARILKWKRYMTVVLLRGHASSASVGRITL